MKKIERATLGIALAVAGLACLPAAARAADNQGFIYGTVETENGNEYTGTLRWGTEETFWDDHFNATKHDPPEEADGSWDRDRERRRIRVFGVTIGYRWDDRRGYGKQFLARFGDIREISIDRGDDLSVLMKSGTRYDLGGGSNDVGATITVNDASLGEVKLAWKKIERITFKPVPASFKPSVTRLYGVLTTEDGAKFEGWVQWDKQECISTDELDGETEDGDVSIEMGRIRAIEKRNRNGAWVELLDGRRMLLEGTNDVDHTTDGIFVEDARFGRVEIQWDEFDRLELQSRSSTGKGYDDYKPGRKLSGTVTDEDGKKHTGTIVYDLDETETWEFLSGQKDDVEYHIPFAMLRSVEPHRDSARVTLKGGEALELEEVNDVNDDNDGVVVRSGDSSIYLEWDQIRKIEFD